MLALGDSLILVALSVVFVILLMYFYRRSGIAAFQGNPYEGPTAEIIETVRIPSSAGKYWVR
jgi:uncharacterized protein involved in cysteine biosynthesis